MSTVIGSFVEESLEIARRAMAQYDFSPRATLDVVNLSENVTLRIEDPVTGEVAAMRLHRTGYHDVAQIKSELLWLDALASSRCVEVPPPIPTIAGERVARIDTLDGERLVSVAGWVDGAMPDAGGDLTAAFGMLGAATAKLHRHAEGWTLPPGFCRRPWGVEQLLGSRPTFGPWRDGLGLGPEELAILEATETAIREDLAGFPDGAGHYGLVHADLRLANLLLDEKDGREVVRVIDFDDCGPSWFMYDFGSAVSFMEDDPRVPELADAWASGYRTIRDLSAASEAQLPTFVMLRRLVLVGWVARNHATATEAAALGSNFTVGACTLAEQYLKTR